MTFTPIAPTLPHTSLGEDGDDESDDVIHITCCKATSRLIALCGVDCTDVPQASDDDEVTCDDCVAMCGTDFCPIFLTCSEV